MITTPDARVLILLTGLGLISMPSHAQDWQLGLGAELEQYFGYVSYDGATSSGFEGFDAVAEGRVFVVPSAVLDNGLTFGAHLHLDAHVGERNAGVKVDEAALFFSGGFGEVLIGKSDTPGNHMHSGAPKSVGPDVNFAGLGSAALPSLLQFSNIHSTVRVGGDLLRGTLGSTYASNMGENTGVRLTYFSPRIAGVQFGISYAPDGPNSAADRQDFFDLGASYRTSFNGVDASLSAKWGRADNKRDVQAHPEYWGLGANLTYGGLSLGGSYTQSSGSSIGLTNGKAFDVGATYRTGRYGFSLHYLNGQNIDNENAALASKERLEALTLAASFALTDHTGRPVEPLLPGKRFADRYENQPDMGAEVFGFISFTDFSEDLGDGGIGTPGDDVDGFVIGTGLRLTF